MKIIITESQLCLLKESILRTNIKGQNMLYHSTNNDKIINILKSNSLVAKTTQKIKTKFVKNNVTGYDGEYYNGVSLTRDSEFFYREFMFILNGDLLKRDFGKKLIPFDYFKSDGNKTKRSGDQFEKEEFLVGNISNLNKYLIGFRMKWGYSLQELNVIEREFFQNYIQSNNIPVYDREWNNISKKILDL